MTVSREDAPAHIAYAQEKLMPQRIFMWCLATLLLAGCGATSSQPSAPAPSVASAAVSASASAATGAVASHVTTAVQSSSAPATAIHSLTLALSFNNLQAVPIWAAVDLHLFQRYGLNVKLTNINGGTQTMAAMASGHVPLATTAGPTVVQPIVKGIPIELVASLSSLMPYDFMVAPSISTASQLNGATGGISGFGSADYYAQILALQQLHVDPKHVTWLSVGNETLRLVALKTKHIQFTALTTGLDAAAIQAGFKPFLKLYNMPQPYQHAAIACTSPGSPSTEQSCQIF